MTTEPRVFCMSITPFDNMGEFDEVAYRHHLNRLCEAEVGIYVASPGSGEGHSLSPAELDRAYRIAVEVCKNRVPIHANPPESRNADEMLRKIEIAVAAGVDSVQLYTVDAGHGMQPTPAEQESYYRTLLSRVTGSVGLSVNVLAGGYVTPIDVYAKLCAEYSQITYINVNQPPTSYLAELMERVGSNVAIYTAPEMLAEGLTLGAKGCLTGHANVIPYVLRSIGYHFARGNPKACGESLRELFRLNRTVAGFGLDGLSALWSARWLKVAMEALDLPGHSGGRMRSPYRVPTPEEKAKLAERLRAIDIAGSEARARSLFAT
jgi:4-hydroxy-tetrahydrodipicolinate synthase